MLEESGFVQMDIGPPHNEIGILLPVVKSKQDVARLDAVAGLNAHLDDYARHNGSHLDVLRPRFHKARSGDGCGVWGTRRIDRRQNVWRGLVCFHQVPRRE